MTAILESPNRQREIIFSSDGTATAGQSGHRYYATRDLTIESVVISAGIAPGGQAIIADVLLDGTTSLFTTTANRPTVAIGANEGVTPAPDITDVPAGHFLTVEVVQVGTSPPGSAVDLRIVYE